MMKTFAFDTRLVVRILRRKLALSTVIQPDDLGILPATTLGELLFGVRRSDDPATKLRELKLFVAPFPLAPVDQTVAGRYADIRMQLELDGTPIPENDMWIAATALARGATLLAADAHFDRIRGLSVINLS